MSGHSNEPGRSVISRALSVLDTFDTSHVNLTLSQIARRSNMPIATVHRVVNELTQGGLLERSTDGSYRIGRRMWRLGMLASVHTGLRDVALPYMEEVFTYTRENVNLAILEGDTALLVERINGRQSVPLATKTGGKLSLHSTGVGKALLAYAPKSTIEMVLSHLKRETPYTVDSPANLRKELETIRRRGYATTSQERRIGTSSVAVPVLVGGEAVAALGVVSRSAESNAARLVPALQIAAGSIARALMPHL
jgi:DNA-binding IclR family transcriptional regulator